jgi:hypothetical protein
MLAEGNINQGTTDTTLAIELQVVVTLYRVRIVRITYMHASFSPLLILFRFRCPQEG